MDHSFCVCLLYTSNKAWGKCGRILFRNTFLDITASFEERKTFTDMVTRVAAEINIPFTVGGGINELKDVDRLLNASTANTG